MRKKQGVILRRAAQSLSFLLFVYIIWTTRYPLRGFINPLVYFHIDPFVMLVTALAERVMLAGLVAAGGMLLLTLVFGRIFCGWFCPLGALIDAWSAVAGLLRRKNPKAAEYDPLRKTKYWLLGVIALFAAGGIQLAWILDPFSIIVRTFSFSIHPAINNLIDKSFIFLLQRGDYAQTLEPVYYTLKDTVLDITNPVFPHTVAILAVFIGILAMVTLRRRAWCRYLCPLGALLAIPARFSLLKRTAHACPGGCSLCRHVCRMNAIKSDNSYLPGECVMCMDCAAACPGDQTFAFARRQKSAEKTGPVEGVSRAQFLSYVGGSLAFLAGCGTQLPVAGGHRRRVIRPPASIPEAEFVKRCIRCGNCMKICMTNALQPALLQSGWSGIWTPHVDTRTGYCEYECNLCGQVCPTGAVRKISVEEKRRTKMGVAQIDRTLCIPWAQGKGCLVCEEHCPLGEKAIKVEEIKGPNGAIRRLPYVEESLCVGCAICESKCPAREKAIRVKPL